MREALESIAPWSIIVIGGLFVVSYAVAQVRGGTITAYKDELLASRESRDRLETELTHAREEVASARTEISRLSGIVEQLRAENAQLRGLVMGEKVPPALERAMQLVADGGVAKLETVLDPIREDIAAVKAHLGLG